MTRKRLYRFQTCEYRHDFQRKVEIKRQHIEIKCDARINDTTQHKCIYISINVNLLKVMSQFNNCVSVIGNGKTFIDEAQKTQVT